MNVEWCNMRFSHICMWKLYVSIGCYSNFVLDKRTNSQLLYSCATASIKMCSIRFFERANVSANKRCSVHSYALQPKVLGPENTTFFFIFFLLSREIKSFMGNGFDGASTSISRCGHSWCFCCVFCQPIKQRY